MGLAHESGYEFAIYVIGPSRNDCALPLTSREAPHRYVAVVRAELNLPVSTGRMANFAVSHC